MGRPKKVTTEQAETNVVSESTPTTDSELIKQLMSQMADLKKQVESVNKEKTDLQDLVNVLKTSNKDTTNESSEKVLPKKVKVVSLIPNTYNLTTEENGHGRKYTFENIGDMITMKTSDLEDILSVMSYRKQAEDGFFYIMDKDIVEDQNLTEEYNKICDTKMVERVCTLDSDECVNILVNMNDEMKESICVKIAENINKGIRIDRNRISDIFDKTNIDIEQMAKALKTNQK